MLDSSVKREVIFIAEIGMNHNGNLDLLHSLIKSSKESGANITKLQLGWRGKEGELNHIMEKDLENIFNIAEYYDQDLMFSIFTSEAFEMIKPFKPKYYKIASRTVVDDPGLVESILEENIHTFISLGFWKKKGLPFIQRDNIDYLWCKSLYPTPAWDLIDLPKKFDRTPYAGISDHSVGIEASLLAISRGAVVVEKHFTYDKSDTTIRDHALSITPKEFSHLVNLGKEISKITYQSI